MLPSLEIILVNRNSGGELFESLSSIMRAEKSAFLLRRVCVVDDASSDNSTARCEALPLPLEILRNPEHRGYGASCNRGAKDCRADYILFLNTDCTLLADSLNSPIRYMEQPEHAGVGIVGIQLLDTKGAVARCSARFPTFGRMISLALGLDRFLPRLFPGHQMKEWDHRETRPVDQVMGAFMLMRRNIFETLGGYDERFFVYMEDLDLSLRTRALGYSSVFLATAQAIHTGGGTAKKVRGESLFFALRSRMQYSFKHFGWWRGAVVAACILGLEPLSRLVWAASRRSTEDLRALAEAYPRLWAGLLRRRPSGKRSPDSGSDPSFRNREDAADSKSRVPTPVAGIHSEGAKP